MTAMTDYAEAEKENFDPSLLSRQFNSLAPASTKDASRKKSKKDGAQQK